MIDIERIIKTLDWMVTDCKHKFDEQGNPGNYSPELTEAINLLEELKSLKTKNWKKS
jgi:hypothetical protein